MKSHYNILVSGCGGDIGQSIGKIFKDHNLANHVVGCDMNLDNAAKFIFDKLFQVPGCRSERYPEFLEKIIKECEIDLILPIAEPELRFFTENKIELTYLGKGLVCANLLAREIGFDKLMTSGFLKNAGLPFPDTRILSDVSAPQLPVIIKDRTGSGSKSVFIIDDMADFIFYQKKFPGFIAQEFLVNDNEEYTCGVFRSNGDEIRNIIFRRKLTGGFSGFGEVIENNTINELLREIAKKINLRGSINVQLRLKEGTPYVFEINPRFSSTVRFRHMMGFEDVIWSIEDMTGQELSDYKKPVAGSKFYKGFNEYIE